MELEPLETRRLLSWSSVPSSLGWSSSAGVGFNSNGAQGTAYVSSNEVDVYSFYAPRSGTYTFKAGKNGSQIDTIAGVYNWSGGRLAGNDDSNGTTDSTFTVYLNGGTHYAYAITNYTGHSNGGYRWSITGPPLSRSLSHNAGDGISTFASASLNGNSLSVTLTGWNSSNWYYFDHKVNVYLVNAQGQAIHTGSWSFGFRTGGRFVPGLPGSKTQTNTWDVSGFDLRNLRDIRLVVS